MDTYVNVISHIIRIVEFNIYFISSTDVIPCSQTNLDNISTLSTIFANIITGVGVIIGYMCLRSFREKANNAAFAFWSQIELRILKINKLLKQNKNLLNNLYTQTATSRWEEESPNPDDLKLLWDSVNETLSYLQSTPDQMPAYNGWSEDFSDFLEFLTDIIQYDIRETERNFITEQCVNSEYRDVYWSKNCNTMDRIISGIRERQKKVERKMYIKDCILRKISKN